MHGCTQKCEREDIESCKYSFPREPSGLTLISAPPLQTIEKEIAERLVIQSDAVKKAVKKAVKNVLQEASINEDLTNMSLQRVLNRAIGAVVHSRSCLADFVPHNPM